MKIRKTRRPARPGALQQLQLEKLEGREVPSAVVHTNVTLAALGGDLTTNDVHYPEQVKKLYGFNQIEFSRPNLSPVTGDGTGQTIAIVVAYDDPKLLDSTDPNFLNSDLKAFDSACGLSDPPSFRKVNQYGGAVLPPADPTGGGWEGEAALDVEWAHAMAPNANILLVEASDTSGGLYTAVNTARQQPGVSVVSMSWGGAEWIGESGQDSTFTTPSGHPGVTFVAASGDIGKPSGCGYPASSPNILAVGGTVTPDPTADSWVSETAWSGSYGGPSAQEPKPYWQIGTPSDGKRDIPDVALCGGDYFAVYDSSDPSAPSPWYGAYGTSASAPVWASLIAIANQGRALYGFSSLDGPSQTLPKIYHMPSADLHDITTGESTTTGESGGSLFHPAQPGYDLVTGRGTPLAASVAQFLAADQAGPGTFNSTNGYWTLGHLPGAPDPAITPFPFGGTPNWQAVAGRWDGLETATVGVAHDGGDGQLWWDLAARNQVGTPDVVPAFPFGGAGWKAVTGDWNGDGITTVGVVHVGGDGQLWWDLAASNQAGTADTVPSFPFGGASWIPVVGDWNGDGITTIGAVQPVNGQLVWHLRDSNSAGAETYDFTYGASSWLPVTGDWNGDGVTTIGVVKPDNGAGIEDWVLRNSNSIGAPDYDFLFGHTGEVPVAGLWRGNYSPPSSPSGSAAPSAGTALPASSTPVTLAPLDRTATPSGTPLPVIPAVPAEQAGVGVSIAASDLAGGAAKSSVSHDVAADSHARGASEIGRGGAAEDVSSVVLLGVRLKGD